ncbi:hypothetical protein GGD63_007943 [Bradyrhizobium sp. cir1]|uniref:hypothetical protein n=1 Tax=Bradyrhizobium sp. cir1 TaxID=1445730 RepID=UPI0017CED61F|nr:hypothetical protein [Bradyrhizobium sp. cir1]MBB4375099.1 hypothetical protein [Bradyrhizobium sp. cir1]
MGKEIKYLPSKTGPKKINPAQGILDVYVDKQTEIQGIEMGVLSDGTPFLTQRGLARLCGVQNAHIGTIGAEWDEEIQKPRITTIKNLLSARGQTPTAPYFDVSDEKRQVYAYPDYVCLAILEYYAFEAGANVKPEAVQNFRQLAGMALREFIYTQLGYSPSARVPDSWSLFHDRVSLVFHTVPHGYFSVFKEMSDIIVTLIRQGAQVDDKFIPDISVGQHWANHWRDTGLEAAHGERIQYEHNYPSYFPQAASNPQPAYCYPDSCLGEFRRWMRDVYLKDKMPTYLSTKAKQGALPPSFVKLALEALSPATRPKALS